MPVPNASGKAPKSEAIVVIRIGRNRNSAARRIASSAGSLSLRSRSSAKSIIMIAFFITMPISSTMPIRPMMSNCVPVSMRASSAPSAADGSVDRIVTGWIKLSYRMPSIR